MRGPGLIHPEGADLNPDSRADFEEVERKLNGCPRETHGDSGSMEDC